MSSVYIPGPGGSLNGEIITTDLFTRLTATPMEKLSVLASYRYNDRDNRTPMKWYNMVVDDMTKQGNTAAQALDTIVSPFIVRNLATSVKQQTGALEGDYTFLPRSNLILGYDWQKTDRTFTEVDDTKENTFRGDLRHTSLDAGLLGSIGYSHAQRRGSNYNNANTYHQTFNTATIDDKSDAAGLPNSAGCQTALAISYGSCQWDNNPNQRKYLYADRDRDQVRGKLGYTPPGLSRLTLQVDLGLNKDDYANSIYGLQDSKGWNSTLDFGQRPS